MSLAFLLLMTMSVTACSSQPELAGSSATSSAKVIYTPSDVDFANPERGFYVQRVGWDRVFHPEWESLSVADMQQARDKGYSLIRVYYLIPEFKGTSLSPEFLNAFQRHFRDARKVGVKLIPLFAYSWPQSGDYANNPNEFANQDAPVSDVLRHLEQLRPVIRNNADVIAVWDAGFIGPWGEWHTSTNENVGPVIGSEVNDKTRRITRKLLETVPAHRMVALRYPRHKQQLTGASALTSRQAFTGSRQARLGAKNDCFLASKTNWGTYLPDDDVSIQGFKDYLHQDNLFVPQLGETCNAAADAQPYIGCANALAELEYLRYSALNINYEANVLEGWRNGGCFEEISKRLGYRFELVSAQMPTRVSKAGKLTMHVEVKNVGFASPYNPRRLELVLRNKATGNEYKLVLNDGALKPRTPLYDPRFWQAGRVTNVRVNRALPSRLPPGRYDVFLNLSDPAPRLNRTPAYSIRFASQDVWEAKTGYNSLLHTIKVVR